MTADPTLDRIGQAVEPHHGRGRREAAHRMFVQIWTEIGGEPGSARSAMTSTAG